MSNEICPRCSGPTSPRSRGSAVGWYCKRCHNATVANYARSNPDRIMETTLWSAYRLRLADYQRMLAEQDGRCAACGRPAGDLVAGRRATAALVVDHDHECCPATKGRRRSCGKCIRGLVCHQCNVAAGMLGDDPERAEDLVRYLRKWRDR